MEGYSCAKDVGEFLLILQECSQKVLIASPRYGDVDYHCDVIADTAKLTVWSKEHAKTVFGCSDKDAARLALPFWFANANYDDESITEICILFRQVLEPYTLEFLELGIAYLFCHECQKPEKEPVLKQLNTDNTDRFNLSYVLDWACSKGHLLRHTEHAIHISY